MIEQDYINEMKETADYIESLSKMSDVQLSYELRRYLYTLTILEKQFYTHREYISLLRNYIDNNFLSCNFNIDLDCCIEEAIYEKSYINNFKCIIKKMLKKKNYFDVDIIYMDVVYLNYINHCRFDYLKQLHKFIIKNDSIDTVYRYDNSEIIHDISCSANKLFKKLKSRK